MKLAPSIGFARVYLIALDDIRRDGDVIADARAIDQDIDTAKPVDRLLGNAFAIINRADIGAESQECILPVASSAPFSCSRVESGDIAINANDHGAYVAQRACHGRAKPARRSRYDCNAIPSSSWVNHMGMGHG
jgi:hypothetical protein